MAKQIIQTDTAPSAIGTYSQAVKAGNTLYISGQIPLIPETMKIISDDIELQIKQVFENLKAITTAAGVDLNHIVKLGIYLTDMADFPAVNEAMACYFTQPYPARAAIGVAALPKNAAVEMDAIVSLE